MYDKIYKEIFLKDFILKRKVYQFPENKSIWEVKIYNKSYFLLVYKDNIADYVTKDELKRKEFAPKNEAELAHFRMGKCSIEKRIVANRLFLELVRRYIKDAPYLCRCKKADKSLMNRNMI